MPYVKRDINNNIICVSGMQSERTPEFVDDNNSELKKHIKDTLNNINSQTKEERRKFEVPTESDTILLLVDVVRYLKLNGTNVGPSGDLLVSLYDNSKVKIDDEWKP